MEANQRDTQIKHPVVLAFNRNPMFFYNVYGRILDKVNPSQIYEILIASYDVGWFNPGCIPPTIKYPMIEKYSKEFIDYGRNYIYFKAVEVLGQNPVYFNDIHISNICSMYFDIFVGHRPKSITYSMDRRKKGKLGECITTRTGEEVHYNIVLAPKIITNCFTEDHSPLVINGITVYNRVQIIQITIEHEIAHYLINNSEYDVVKMKCTTGDKVFGHHGSLFRKVVSAYFGHTATTGSITKPDKLSSKDFTIGQKASFMYNGKKLTGEVIKINKKTIKILVNLDEEQTAHCDVYYANILDEK